MIPAPSLKMTCISDILRYLMKVHIVVPALDPDLAGQMIPRTGMRPMR